MSSDVVVAIWIVANLSTGIAYYHIPYEIWHWFKDGDRRGLNLIGSLFVAFILSCGTHHLVMLRKAHSHADPAQVIVDSLMALISVAVSFVLWSNRAKIRRIIAAVREDSAEIDRATK